MERPERLHSLVCLFYSDPIKTRGWLSISWRVLGNHFLMTKNNNNVGFNGE